MSMREFIPENNATTMYINCGTYGDNAICLGDLMEQAEIHFGQYIDWRDIDITAKHIQTRGIGFDLYDSSDFTNYIVLTKR